MYTEQVDTLLRFLGIELDARCKSSPIHLAHIANVFNIKVKHLPFDDEVSGMFIRSNKGHYIYINKEHHFNRRRFSLGHELGHYYLGHPGDVTTNLPDDIIRQMEVEANKFSSCILMPHQLIEGLAKQHMNIPELANWLRVSRVAAAFRCRDLGYRVEEAEDIISDYRLEMGDRFEEWSLEQVAATYEPA